MIINLFCQEERYFINSDDSFFETEHGLYFLKVISDDWLCIAIDGKWKKQINKKDYPPDNYLDRWKEVPYSVIGLKAAVHQKRYRQGSHRY